MRLTARIFSLVAVGVLALTSCRLGERDLEKVEIFTQYHGVTFVDKFKVWATGPDELIARDAFFEPENYVYDGSAVYLTALRGETEAFQLVINADYGNINDVDVDVAPLAGPGGARIAADRIYVYFEYYVTVETPGDYRGRAGAVPDPLPPLAEPFDLAKAQAQPLFVVVDVPYNAKAGRYAGDVVVSAKNAETQKLTLEVMVLPEVLEPSLLPPAFVEPDYRAIAAWEERKPELPLKNEKLAPYLDLFSSRGVRALDGGYSQRRLTTSKRKAAEGWAAAAGGVTPTFFYLSPTAEGVRPDIDAMAEEYKALYDGWGEKKPASPVIWTAFEGGSSSPLAEGPSSAARWRDLAKAASTWPGKPALAAATSPYRDAPGASLGASVSCWVPAFRDVAICPERYQNISRGQYYFLRADGSGADVLDGRRAGPRLLSWYGYLWGAAGVIALAPPAKALRPRNPWSDDPMVGTAAEFGNGLATWFYPGGPAGVEAPVSSIRLELLRQGLEDWALFKMVEKKRGRDYVRERLEALLPYAVEDVGDVSVRELGHNQIFELRRALLAELAAAPAAGRPAGIAGHVVDAAGNTFYHARVAGGDFATYTAEDGSYRLWYGTGQGPLEVSAPGFRNEPTNGGPVKLYRGLKGLLPVFDFEAGIDAAFWLSGDESDALAVSEERGVVREGKIAVAVEFPCGRTSRVVNLYPRLKDFSKYHRFEFFAYNPNDFIVDLWLLLLDDETLDVGRQYRRRISLRPRAWTCVSYRVEHLPQAGEPTFGLEADGSYVVKPAYLPDLSRIIGVGFEADGLTAYGGKGNAGSYKVVIDDVKLVTFE